MAIKDYVENGKIDYRAAIRHSRNLVVKWGKTGVSAGDTTLQDTPRKARKRPVVSPLIHPMKMGKIRIFR